MKTIRFIPGTVFAVFFAIYLFSLPLFGARFQSALLFGSDDMFAAYNGHPVRNLIEKHPLFVVVMLLYRVATWLVAWAPPTFAHNFSMVFPMATLGAASVTLGYYAFLRLCDNRETALLFTALYGVSASAWFFGSYPETYILTTFCTNLMLCAVLAWPKEPGAGMVARTAFLNVLACYCSPQQIFLAIVPLLRWPGRSLPALKSYLRRAIWYVSVLALLFLIPYETYLKVMGKGWRFGPVYLQVYARVSNLAHPNWILLVAANFLIFSVIGPSLPPSYFTDPSLKIFRALSLSWLAVALVLSLFLLISLLGLRRQGGERTLVLPLLALVVADILFFVYFNPSEAYLYVLPALLPWLLVLQIGFVRFTRSWGNMRRIALCLLIGVVMANNLHFRIYLQHLKSNVAAVRAVPRGALLVPPPILLAAISHRASPACTGRRSALLGPACVSR